MPPRPVPKPPPNNCEGCRARDAIHEALSRRIDELEREIRNNPKVVNIHDYTRRPVAESSFENRSIAGK